MEIYCKAETSALNSGSMFLQMHRIEHYICVIISIWTAIIQHTCLFLCGKGIAPWLCFFVIWAKLQLPRVGLYCSEPSLRKLSPQLPPNLFSSPPPTSTALFHLTAILGQRSLLFLLHGLSRTLNSCITNPFPIRLANMFEILFLSLCLCLFLFDFRFTQLILCV